MNAAENGNPRRKSRNVARLQISVGLLRWLRRIATEPEKVSNADAQLHQKDAQAILAALGHCVDAKSKKGSR